MSEQQVKLLAGILPYLTPQHLQGKRATVTISAVAIEELYQAQTMTNEPKIVLSFQGKTLRLPLNKTQATTIADMTGIPVFAEWVGHKIQLAPAIARNKKPTIAISEPPKPKAALEGSNQGAPQPKHEPEPAASAPSIAKQTPAPVELGAATLADQTDYQKDPFAEEQ